jgi:hypothetical protein
LNSLWGSAGTPLKPRAFGISLDWFRYFLVQDAQLDWTTITPAAYERLWDQSVEQYGAVIGTDNPDLTGFRDHGGKVIIWHGWADPLISTEGTVDYFKRVQERWEAHGRHWSSRGSSWRRASAIVAEAPGPLRRPVGCRARVAGRRQSAGHTGRGTPGSGGSDHTIASALPVSARRQV